MTKIFEARTVTASIARPPRAVYDFVSNPANLPTWSFFDSVVQSGDRWLATSSAGEAFIAFAPANDFGVLDHTVHPATGGEVSMPVRVIPNGGGSELIFTVLRPEGSTDEEFDRDVATVTRDLQTLKSLLQAT
jgi:hypothetical protein